MTGERRDLATRQGSYVPATFAETRELCEYLAKSELVPAEFKGKPHNIFIAIQLGADLGLSPMQALQSIAVFGGKPTLYGDVGLALALNSGLLEDFTEWYDEDTKTAHCRAKRVGGKDVERTFSDADARRAQVWDKGANKMVALASRYTYLSYPKRMHQMRARWWCLRDVVPDVFKGLVGREEIEDITPLPEVRDMGAAVRVDEEANPFAPRERETPEAAHDPQATDTGAGATSTPTAPPVVGSGGAGGPGGEPASLPDEPVAGAGPALGSDGVHVPAPAGRAPEPARPLEKGVGGDRTTLFELNGQRFATCGVTKDQMLTLFKLCAQVNRKKGRLYDKKLLVDEFGIETRMDLTAEAAEQYRIRLTEILEGA